MAVDPVEVADGDRGEVDRLTVRDIRACDDGVAQEVFNGLTKKNSRVVSSRVCDPVKSFPVGLGPGSHVFFGTGLGLGTVPVRA